MNLDQPRCWICLGEGTDVPPMGTRHDAQDWIQPCACSLVAHRKCLLNWITSMDMQENRREANLNMNRRGNRIVFNVGIENPTAGVPFLADSTNILIKCPQCQKEIFLKTSSGPLLNIRKMFQDYISSITRVTVISTLVSSTVASYALGMTAGSSASGMKILQTLAPNSVQLSLFDVSNAPNLVNAIDRGRVPVAKFLFITAAIPPYLYILKKRFAPAMHEAFVQLFPFIFFADHQNLLEAGPKRALLFISPVKFLYGLFYRLTYNRLYYKWAKSVQPCIMAESLSAETLEQIEQENEEEEEIQKVEAERRIKLENSLKGTHSGAWIFLRRILHYMMPGERIRQIRFARFKREIECCFKTDFGVLFSRPRFYYSLATTLVWPAAGEWASRKLLAKIPLLVNLINKNVATPDQATFVRNLLGCFAVVVASDLVSLFFAWRKVRQLQNIRILKYGTPEWKEAANARLQE